MTFQASRIVYFGIVLLVCGGVTSCGGSRPSGDSHPFKHISRVVKYPIEYAPNGLRTLVRKRLPGGYFVITAKRYRYLGHTYSVLQDSHQPDGHEMSPGSNGPNIEARERVALEMGISSGCDGSFEYSVAYGMLRDPMDTVIARARGVTAEFKKVVIPASFHPDGVLVYAPLRRGPVDIVTRAPNGQIVSSESYSPEFLTCE